MIKVGITGGIGSGKSIICQIFNRLGPPVYDADARAKALMTENKEIIYKLSTRFGSNLYKNGQLDRKMLAGIIFEDKQAIGFVNSVIHPAVEADFTAWSLQYQSEPYVIEEAALHFESGAYKNMNVMIMVFAPVEIRLKRVIQRDSGTREQVEARMNNQLPDTEKIKRSDFVIYNDDKQSIMEQVLKIHNELISRIN